MRQVGGERTEREEEAREQSECHSSSRTRTLERNSGGEEKKFQLKIKRQVYIYSGAYRVGCVVCSSFLSVGRCGNNSFNYCAPSVSFDCD